MDNIKDFKQVLKDKGYTQEQFAKEVLHISRMSLYRKIEGIHKFSELEKEKIKEVLGIDL